MSRCLPSGGLQFGVGERVDTERLCPVGVQAPVLLELPGGELERGGAGGTVGVPSGTARVAEAAGR